MPDKRSPRLVVVGGGPGGYAAAFLAADVGMQATLVDTEANPGGVCLYRGCIPSKALLHVARLLTEAEAAAAWGISFGAPRMDLDRLRRWKDDVVGKLTSGLGDLTRQRKVRYVRGYARFRSARSVWVDKGKGDTETVDFDHAILATGSRAATLPFLPEDPRIWTSSQALQLPEIPSSLLVIGGGYIGLELGSVYAALGSRVTVVEMTSSLLPGVDPDLVRPLAARVAEHFEEIVLDAKVVQAKGMGRGIRVALEGKDVSRPERYFDAVLVAVGRTPRSGDLGLDNTQVELDDSGFIQVDDQRRTDEPAVFAIGDVAGQPMLAHKAAHEGRTAVEAIAGAAASFDARAIPAVVFTDPEVAWCGLTESDARARGAEIQVARFPWAASGRAATLGRSDGVTKLILEPGSGRVLGVGVAGPGAGELIAEGVLAVEMGATAADLKMSIHPHPTLSETVMEAAEVFFGQATHFHRPRRRTAG